MHTDFYYESKSGIRLHACKWLPHGQPRGIVQIVHGIADYAERYDFFAQYLTEHGFVVVAEDHMGHGGSVCPEVPLGCFRGGWMDVVADTYQLLEDTMAEYPGVPYVLFGHSMGSFIARSILARYPDSGISAAVICGTAWLPTALVAAGIEMCTLSCKLRGEDKPNQMLYNMVFGSYNKKVERPRTPSDWLTRDERIVDAYESDPLCGFVPSAGMLRDMMTGIRFNQKEESLNVMQKGLTVYFIAGGDDPVGAYGYGVRKAAQQFKKHGMQNVSVKIYPLCRHEILNEINKEEVFSDILNWLESTI